MIALRGKKPALEKELQTKETAWERDRVSLDQQLITKWGDEYKDEADHYRAEHDDARKEGNNFKMELDLFSSDYQQLTEEAKPLRDALTSAKEETCVMSSDLATLRTTASYKIRSGSLRVTHTPCRAELLWLSEGSVEHSLGAVSDFGAAEFDALADLMRVQRDEVAQACQTLVAHKEQTPEFALVLAIYTCVGQLVAGLDDYMRQQLAPHLASMTSAATSLADEIAAAPERSSSCIMLEELNTSTAGDAQLQQDLALSPREAQLAKDYAEQ